MKMKNTILMMTALTLTSFGQVEVRMLGGLNHGERRELTTLPRYGQSIGVDAAVKLVGGLSATGTFMHNQLGQIVFKSCPYNCSNITQTITMKEFMGGARYTFNRHGLIAPYAGFNVGMVQTTNHAIARPLVPGGPQDYSPAERSTSVNKLAWSSSAGVAVNIKRFGLGLDYTYLQLAGVSPFAFRRYAFDQQRLTAFVGVRF